MIDYSKWLAQCPTARAWEHIQLKPHHGVAVPLFSLHTQKSCGIGEYLDLLPFIDFCIESGFDIIQLLPLNDTGLGTSPYDALSAFALSPLHLSLTALPHLESLPNGYDRLKKMAYWTATDKVKHHIVRELKSLFFKDYVPHVKPHLIHDPSFIEFKQAQKSWLDTYCLFRVLKEIHFWKSWEQWPLEDQNPTDHHYQALLNEHHDAIVFHEILQYLCYSQMKQVKELANKKGLFIKGDIPILVNTDSADVWRHRSLFDLKYQAGAPPDMYSREGQNWGFPLYNWENLERQDFQWWRKRLQYAAHFYDIYRIDHIVGFFRIWAIARGKPATAGHYLPDLPAQWVPFGTKIMKMMISSSDMLPIGEDLGAVPSSVKQALKELGICGTKVMRWERFWEEDHRFIPPSEYDPISMTTVSTHDSDTLQLWWKHHAKDAKDFCAFKGWDYRPVLDLDAHEQILIDSHHSRSLFHINLLQEYLALFPHLVSIYPSDERINIPGKVLESNWTYRCRPSVEQLQENYALKQKIKEIILGGN